MTSPRPFPPLAAILVATFLFCQHSPLPAAPALSDAEIEQRIDALLPQMSIEEKAIQLASAYPNANLRLGIPQLLSGEALHGVCADKATSFPQAVGLGATWDTDLVERIGRVIGREGRALGMHQCFAPMLALARDPRWGRVEEAYGEDPWHVSRMAVAYILGVQGRDGERFGPDHMICTPKHFAADGDSLRGGNAEAVEISEATLRETAFVPFEAAVREAGTVSIMPAHHALNRIPCHANQWLLGQVLREEWKFDGFITSDYGDIAKSFHWDIASGHYFAPSYEEAGHMALKAGIDMELMGGTEWDAPKRTYGSTLVQAVQAGRIPVSLLDRSVRRVLRTKFQLGLFGQPIPAYYDPSKGLMKGGTPSADFDPWATAVKKGGHAGLRLQARPDRDQVLADPTHRALALEAARKSIVLLKNDGPLLPLNPEKLKTVAVLGPNAAEVVLGGYSNKPAYAVTVLDGIRKFLGDRVQVTHAQGCALQSSPTDDIPAAVALARAADVSIVVVGTSRKTMGENLDRSILELTGSQQALVEAVHATGKPVVVVLINGGALAIPWIQENVPAIVDAWYGGQEGGNAVADVLFGASNPGGRLPVTFPYSTGMTPCYYNALPPGGPQKYAEGEFRVLYPFGHGLSYTTFEISPPRLDKPSIRPEETATLTVRVTNTGTRAGDEVVQLYLKRRFAATVRPPIALVGFQRLTLAPGESRDVSLPVGPAQLRSWTGGKWTVEPGEFQLTAGPDSIRGGTVSLTVK